MFGHEHTYSRQNGIYLTDDQAVLAEDKENLEYMARNLKETYVDWRLTIKMENVKYLCIGRKNCNLQLDKSKEFMGYI